MEDHNACLHRPKDRVIVKTVDGVPIVCCVCKHDKKEGNASTQCLSVIIDEACLPATTENQMAWKMARAMHKQNRRFPEWEVRALPTDA